LSSHLLDNSRSHYYIGLDVGGTKIEALAVDQSKHVISQINLPTNTSSVDQTVESIVSGIQLTLERSQIPLEQVAAVGIGIPGQVKEGVVNLAVNLNMESYPLAETLHRTFGVPFILENDGRTATLGAYTYLRSKEPIHNMAYLSIGTGISAGIILQGKLYRGSNGMAGEIGHIVIEPYGPRCNCGSFGCLEVMASGPAIAQQAAQEVASGQDTILKQVSSISAQDVFHAAELNDPVARRIIKRSSAYLSRAVHWLVMAYDVEKVVLGGGVSHAGEALLKPIQEGLAEMGAISGLAKAMLPEEKTILLPDYYRAGSWGAIELALQISSAMVPE
jgi:glucokinase